MPSGIICNHASILKNIYNVDILYFLGLVISHPRSGRDDALQLNDEPTNHDLSPTTSGSKFQILPLKVLDRASNIQQPKDGPPNFNTKNMKRTVTAIKGKTIELSCNVDNLGNRTVIKDTSQCLHVLTKYTLRWWRNIVHTDVNKNVN